MLSENRQLFSHLSEIPSSNNLKHLYPISKKQQESIEKARESTRCILDQRDKRRFLIVGPCSFHDIASARDYAKRLSALQKEVENTFLLIMRVYFEKPRTRFGWKGFINDPYLDSSHQMKDGLILARQFLLELAEMELPVATEFLNPISAPYFEDLITWGCIGARTCESPIHRHLASNLSMPIALKNSTAGEIEAAINAVESASISHTGFTIDENGRPALQITPGNPYSHICLRGGVSGQNCDPVSIELAIRLLKQANLDERMVVDCSHGNAPNGPEDQISVFQSLIHQTAEGNDAIRGIILESHLNAGKQPLLRDPKQLIYGVSITDPCLDFETTEKLILWGQEFMQKQKSPLHVNAKVY